jgi:uncharacterized membrane protein
MTIHTGQPKAPAQRRAVVLARPGVVAAVVAATAVALLLAYFNKARCAGPPFDAEGRSVKMSELKNQIVCYSDIQYLWLGRGINQHLFPYINGAINVDGNLVGGTVEYPVLSGLLMWIGALWAENDAQFLLYSALLLAPFGLATAWLLGRLTGWRALLWAATPPLVLYGFHNWELPVVLTSVAAIYVTLQSQRWDLRTRGIIAAVILGIGFCLKTYPGFFVLPLLLYVLTGGEEGRELPGARPGSRRGWDSRGWDIKGALLVGASALGTIVAINLPFAIAGREGWWASFQFQTQREADITTNSIWYWGLRPQVDDIARYNDIVSTWSPSLVIGSFIAAAAIGWLVYRRAGTYPWIGVSAAMVCGFLLLHKVHSPQFTLWLLPFFVLLRVPWQLIAAYLVADIAMGVGVFRYFYDLGRGVDPSGGSELATYLGVWGQAVGLVVLYIVFLTVRPRFATALGGEPAVARKIDEKL